MSDYSDKYESHECGCTFVRKCHHASLKEQIASLEAKLKKANEDNQRMFKAGHDAAELHYTERLNLSRTRIAELETTIALLKATHKCSCGWSGPQEQLLTHHLVLPNLPHYATFRMCNEPDHAELEAAVKARDERITSLEMDCSTHALAEMGFNRRRKELEEALRSLVDALNKCHDDPRYLAVWTNYMIHGGKYAGPFYIDELRAAEALLSPKDVSQ